ncbi:MAG: hypothetical protein ABSH20_17600 [Tepidisphaeraceae bacterium]
MSKTSLMAILISCFSLCFAIHSANGAATPPTPATRPAATPLRAFSPEVKAEIAAIGKIGRASTQSSKFPDLELARIAIPLAMAGDFEGALAATQKGGSFNNAAAGWVVVLQQKAGGNPPTPQVLRRLRLSGGDNFDKGMAEAYAWAGDLPNARKTIAGMYAEIDPDHLEARLAVLRHQPNKQDLADVVKRAAKTTPADIRIMERIAGIHILLGDLDAARRMIDGLPDADRKANVLWQIARAQAIAGDIAGAIKTAEQIPPRECITQYEQAYTVIAIVRAAAGDEAGTTEAASKIKGLGMARAQSLSVYARARAGDTAGAASLCEQLSKRSPDTTGALGYGLLAYDALNRNDVPAAVKFIQEGRKLVETTRRNPDKVSAATRLLATIVQGHWAVETEGFIDL